MRVVHDGRAFDLARIPTGQLGIGIMRERASGVGAGLEIDTRPRGHPGHDHVARPDQAAAAYAAG